MELRMRIYMAVGVLVTLLAAAPAGAASVDHPRSPVPSWFTQDFRQEVNRAGLRGVGVKGPSVLDVCPGAVFHEGGVGAGTCLVYPAGCTANFVYYRGSGGRAPAVARGRHYLGSAGHCSKREGQPVYAAISTPGAGPGIARIGAVSKRVKDYDGPRVRDFEAIRIRDGYRVYPQSPAGGPQRVYDGCQAGIPLKYYGNGYEAVVGQGKPEAGVARIWYDGGYGWLGPAFGGDSGSGVLNGLTNQAAGNLTAV